MIEVSQKSFQQEMREFNVDDKDVPEGSSPFVALVMAIAKWAFELDEQERQSTFLLHAITFDFWDGGTGAQVFYDTGI